MTKLKLLAYNTRTGFGHDSTRKKLIKFVKSLDPDIAFFSDALPQHIPEDTLNLLRISFDNLGYDILVSDTERTDRTDWTRPMGISKRSLGAKHFYNGLRNETYNVEINNKLIIGKHFDDRNEHLRSEGVDLLKNADIVMGDINAMHRSSFIARVLQIFMPFTNRLKEINTDISVTKNPILHAIGIFKRFVAMSQGDVLARLTSFGFIETNKKISPTIHGIAQLDHILVKSDIAYSDFKVHKNIKLSDHKPISLNIEF